MPTIAFYRNAPPKVEAWKAKQAATSKPSDIAPDAASFTQTGSVTTLAPAKLEGTDAPAQVVPRVQQPLHEKTAAVTWDAFQKMRSGQAVTTQDWQLFNQERAANSDSTGDVDRAPGEPRELLPEAGGTAVAEHKPDQHRQQNQDAVCCR